jgi:hypothetical protein
VGESDRVLVGQEGFHEVLRTRNSQFAIRNWQEASLRSARNSQFAIRNRQEASLRSAGNSQFAIRNSKESRSGMSTRRSYRELRIAYRVFTAPPRV